MIGQRWIMSDNERPRGLVRDIPAATSCGNLNEASWGWFFSVAVYGVASVLLESLLLAGLSFSAMLTILAPITIGAHIAFNQAWADGEGGEDGGGHGGEGGDGHRATCNRLSTD